MEDIKYESNLYDKGLQQYNSINTKLEILIERLAKVKDKAKGIESEHPSIYYDGIYRETFENLTEQFDKLKLKLETSKSLIDMGIEIILKFSKNGTLEFPYAYVIQQARTDYNMRIELKEGIIADTNLIYDNIYKENYTPQGITVVEDQIIISAYQKGKPPKLYIYDAKNMNKRYSVILNDKESVHAGGITYDKSNHVLLVTSSKGKVNAFDFDKLTTEANKLKENAYEDGDIELNLNDRTYSSIKLKSNINMNYSTLENGNKATGYNAATVYYDNHSNKLFIARFAKNGKIIQGDLHYDKAKKTYEIVNSVTADIDNGVQGISTYSENGKTYLVESRSYGFNKGEITVRDITDGIDNSTVVGSEKLDKRYAEGIQVDKNGRAILVFESGTFGKNKETEVIDIKKIIEENNGKNKDIKINTDDYEKGEQTEEGY